jgi:hypothetical protein
LQLSDYSGRYNASIVPPETQQTYAINEIKLFLIKKSIIKQFKYWVDCLIQLSQTVEFDKYFFINKKYLSTKDFLQIFKNEQIKKYLIFNNDNIKIFKKYNNFYYSIYNVFTYVDYFFCKLNFFFTENYLFKTKFEMNAKYFSPNTESIKDFFF